MPTNPTPADLPEPSAPATANYALLIFDVDGTLVDKFTLRWRPGAADFFAHWRAQPARPRVALATNQGGVAMRLWLEGQNARRAHGYPTAQEIEERLRALTEMIGGEVACYAAYSYRDPRAGWLPTPPEQQDNPRWQTAWRKPAPGMLLQAMQDAAVTPVQTLMVGDSPDDQSAAQAAGCAFAWAGAFFGAQNLPPV